MSNVRSPEPKVSSVAFEDRDSSTRALWSFHVGRAIPTAEELSVLTGFERQAFRLVRRMNQDRWKRFSTCCQRVLGAGWIHLSTYNIMNVYGLKNLNAVDTQKPILLVANHRS